LGVRPVAIFVRFAEDLGRAEEPYPKQTRYLLIRVPGLVIPSILAREVKGPVLLEVSTGAQSAQPEHSLSAA
jgi:hypothetical protein